MAGEKVSFEKAVDDREPSEAYERSSIAFPYLDLDAGVEVARAVYNRSGLGGCDLDELAAEMGQTMSGAFRLKTATAKTFGLVDREGKSGIKLTPLGQNIVTTGERAARVTAFMNVPLYSAIFEKYKGHLLPPMKALEREMLSLGVSSKQTDKARQAFERSAKQAGFFEAGDDRLVRPRLEGAGATTLPTDSTSNAKDPAIEQQKATDIERKGAGGGGEPPSYSGKPLEYQLIDLMSEPDIPDDVKASIWSLVQYLAARKKKQGKT